MSDKVYYIHNKHDKTSREWVEAHKDEIDAGKYVVIDWYDELARDAVLKRLSKETGKPLEEFYRVSEIGSFSAFIGERKELIETLDKDGNPVEVEVIKPSEWKVIARREVKDEAEALSIIEAEQEKVVIDKK